MNRRLFTSESVTEGHPDKIADQISDAVLDTILAEDPNARVACECAITTGTVFVFGEITTTAYCDIPKVVRGVIRDIGYTDARFGFDADTCGVLVAIDEQSPDIAQGVEVGGAGDQGMMMGYACTETADYMPLPIHLAHDLAQRLGRARHEGVLSWARPDGKTQVTVGYDNAGHPTGVEAVLVSSQHDPEVDNDTIYEQIQTLIVDPSIPESLRAPSMRRFVNPTGRFVVGGPYGDAGLTGRKIIVDTYGGYSRHGGGAFSGKDPTKVDRSGAYAARWLAKNIVAAGLVERCELHLAYAIGLEQPLAITVDCFGTEQVDPDRILATIAEHVDLSPAGIIQRLGLRAPIYRQTATYGHFGRADLHLPWEALNLQEVFTSIAGNDTATGNTPHPETVGHMQ